MAIPNSPFDALISHTLRNLREPLADNLSDNNIVLAVMKTHGGVVETEGGYELQANLLYGANGTVSSYRGYDVLNVAPVDGITAATFDWKQIAGTVSISNDEVFKNSGSRTKLKDLVDSKVTQLDISFEGELNRQMLADGSGNDGKDITGLDILVEDGTAWSEVGNIDSNVYTWWRNQFLDFDTGFGTTFATTASGQKDVDGVRAFRRMLNLCKQKKSVVNLILTSNEIAEAYESVATGSHLRITQNQKLADLGFTNIEFKGVPIVWDADVAADDAFFLNTKFLKFVIGKGKNMTMSDFVEPADQDARVAKMLLYANFTLSNRARQGRIIDLTV